MRTLKSALFRAGLIAGLAGVGFEAQAVAVQCPGTAQTNDREFTLDTSPGAFGCLAFGPGNINGNNDPINMLGWITLDKSDDGTSGLFPNAITTPVPGDGTTNGSFSFTPPPGFTDFVLALKSGEGQLDPDWAAFRLPAGVTSGEWSISGQQGLSHINLYGRRGDQVPEPGTMALLGLGLVAVAFARRRRR